MSIRGSKPHSPPKQERLKRANPNRREMQRRGLSQVRAHLSARGMARGGAALRSQGALLRRGGGGDRPPLPPFMRLPRPKERLPQDYDLVYNDGVAPELLLDFDAPNYSRLQATAMWATALSGIFVVYQFIAFLNPESQRPDADQELPFDNLKKELGYTKEDVIGRKT